MILSQIQLSKPLKHELNNQGCLCKMCQKIIKEEMKKIIIQHVVDHESESYNQNQKQYYLKIIHTMMGWELKKRKLRFTLPQICVYENEQPVELISKKHENFEIKCVKEKAKLHQFEIIQFFLEGYVFHNPDTQKTQRKRAVSFALSNHTQKYKNQCIVVAKYQNNFHELLTLAQMEGLFKSRQKHMRNGLMYVQTLVCSKSFIETRINVNLKEYLGSQKFQRAKIEIKMLFDEIKSTDLEYITEQEQILYEKQLKNKDMRQYLEYITLKIILALSKKQVKIISQGIFKYAYFKGMVYLIDVRVLQMSPSEQYWTSQALKVFEYRLARRMSMMDIGHEQKKEHENSRYLGKKAQNISEWLGKSTEVEWDQMKTIRTRLQRLEREKKSLMKSQEAALDRQINRSFQVRKVRKY